MKDTKDVNEEPKFRYRVGYSKGIRWFWSILIVLLMFFLIRGTVDIAKEGEQRLGECAPGFIGAGIYLVYMMIFYQIHIDVYKGKIVYDRILWKKEYLLSEFGEAKEDVVPLVVMNHGTEWRNVYVFYDRNGKKLFKVDGMCVNGEKFYKEIKYRYSQIWNSQKKKGVK